MRLLGEVISSPFLTSLFKSCLFRKAQPSRFKAIFNIALDQSYVSHETFSKIYVQTEKVYKTVVTQPTQITQ